VRPLGARDLAAAQRAAATITACSRLAGLASVTAPMRSGQQPRPGQRAYLEGEPSSGLQAAAFGVAALVVMFGPVFLLLLVARTLSLPRGSLELVALFGLIAWFAFLLPRVDAPQAWLMRRRRLKAGLLPTKECPDRCACAEHRPAAVGTEASARPR
jgi:hypothetical protein